MPPTCDHNIITVPDAATSAPPPPTTIATANPPSRRPKYCFIKTAAIAVMLVGLAVLFSWAILRPTKPTFHLQDATLQAFNLTDSNSRLLTTSLQVTISSRNPNSHLGIDYVSIRTYALYRGQKITQPVELPQGYLGNKEVVEWSPILSGERVSLSADMAQLMTEDLKAGVVLVDFKVYGRLTWKIGTLFTWKYKLDVDCPAFLNKNLPAGDRNGTVIGRMVNGDGGVKYDLGDHACNVNLSL
ncbi:NDR1/HIN1-like protein 1 [Linum perenne]